MSIKGVCNFRSIFLLDLSTHFMASISGLVRVAFVFLWSIYYLPSSILFSSRCARFLLNDSLYYTTSSYCYLPHSVFSQTTFMLPFTSPSLPLHFPFTSLYFFRVCLLLRAHPSPPLPGYAFVIFSPRQSKGNIFCYYMID
ncbi:hypothetical protein BDW66DRAFT_36760 [Aspergillus desertorum]